ncbi:hypothetical protein Mapa_010455 [Marchantia paleacea]|nr:hypothetical protein Mapa_010455 [Marchantia paleacea]
MMLVATSFFPGPTCGTFCFQASIVLSTTVCEFFGAFSACVCEAQIGGSNALPSDVLDLQISEIAALLRSNIFAHIRWSLAKASLAWKAKYVSSKCRREHSLKQQQAQGDPHGHLHCETVISSLMRS